MARKHTALLTNLCKYAGLSRLRAARGRSLVDGECVANMPRCEFTDLLLVTLWNIRPYIHSGVARADSVRLFRG